MLKDKMVTHLIDKTNRYTFEKEFLKKGDSRYYSTGNQVRTLFVHKGSVIFEPSNPSEAQKHINQHSGIIIPPGLNYMLKSQEDYTGFQTSSIAGDRPLIEVIDDGVEKKEVLLEKYRIIENPKVVSKPWGWELWVSWLKNHHVLKQIGMRSGEMSSLQLHKFKEETNYLTEGEANVISGYKMDLNLSEEEMKKRIEGLDWGPYTTLKKTGDSFSSNPGNVHRVMAVTDYIAYETSTPELDDVIRLSDVTGRESGRIKTEHTKK